MIRGDSFRSACRVPTHICCALGTTMSIDKMVQAMGRATYGESRLADNGFETSMGGECHAARACAEDRPSYTAAFVLYTHSDE